MWRLHGSVAADHEARTMTRSTRWAIVAVCTLLAGVTSILAQPPPMTATGCCCVVDGVAWRCTEKTQADCLALQPKAPVFPKIADWKKAWDAYVAPATEPSRA